MKVKTIIVMHLLIFNLFSCSRNTKYLNEIVFKDEILSVQDSLIQMQSLLKKLPPNSGGFNTNYQFRSDLLTVNTRPGMNWDSVGCYTKKTLSILSTDEQLKFVSLAKYLKENYITAGFINKRFNVVFFEYRDFPNNGFKYSRDVAMLNYSDIQKISNRYNILDQKKLIYLVGPIDFTER